MLFLTSHSILRSSDISVDQVGFEIRFCYYFMILNSR